MNSRILALGFLVFFSSVTTVAFAQKAPRNSPNRSGDYYSNEAPEKGMVRSPLSPGSLWSVVAPKLNCRSDPGTSSQIIKIFSRGDIIQAEVGRGGSDEVLINSRDNKGKPWMKVRGGKVFNSSSSLNCYVRDNSLYIEPYYQQR